MNWKTFDAELKSTLKSEDTEGPFEIYVTRLSGYLWALLFKRLGIHPNVVTIVSIVLGALAGYMFYFEDLTHTLWGIFLLIWANWYDCADGQLARMTGQKTRLGRILDGAASEVWFIPIYIALVYRFYIHHGLEFQLIGLEDNAQNAWIVTLLLFVMVLYSGFVCHSHQCGIADYYRQIHLYFLKGEAGSELDTSLQQQKIYEQTPWKGNILWKLFLKNYIGYTRRQEKQTPNFQNLMKKLREKYGDTENIPQDFRAKFRMHSLPMMKWTNILTFNTRAIVLYTTCLIDLPWVYFFFEVFIMTAICRYMRFRHERFCKDLCSLL